MQRRTVADLTPIGTNFSRDGSGHHGRDLGEFRIDEVPVRPVVAILILFITIYVLFTVYDSLVMEFLF